MKRQVSLEEISDGRLYGRRDMAKVGCAGCRGCSQCCHGMGNSVILDPLDLHRLTGGTGLSFEQLMAANLLELNVADGIILPNLSMSGKDEACGFLSDQGRCRIHPYRPGFCRLFPLGRYYLPQAETGGGRAGDPQAETGGGRAGDQQAETGGGRAGDPQEEISEGITGSSPTESGGDRTESPTAVSGGGGAGGQAPGSHKAGILPDSGAGSYGRVNDDSLSFRYILQVHECPAPNKTKVRIEKWLDQPEPERYENFVLQWHRFLLQAGRLAQAQTDPEREKNINLYILKLFYLIPYDARTDFYKQFEARLLQAADCLELTGFADAVKSVSASQN